MANPTWPATLPNPEYSLSYQAPDNDIIKTSVDAGPGKTRRRWTSQYGPVSATIMVTGAELATFKTFYETTLKKVLPFDWTDFRTSTTATYRFTKGPSYSAAGYDYWRVDLPLEILP